MHSFHFYILEIRMLEFRKYEKRIENQELRQNFFLYYPLLMIAEYNLRSAPPLYCAYHIHPALSTTWRCRAERHLVIPKRTPKSLQTKMAKVVSIFAECAVTKPVNIYIMDLPFVTPAEPSLGELPSKAPNPRFAIKSVWKWVSVPWPRKCDICAPFADLINVYKWAWKPRGWWPKMRRTKCGKRPLLKGWRGLPRMFCLLQVMKNDGNMSGEGLVYISA